MPRSTSQIYQDLARLLNELDSRNENVAFGDSTLVEGNSGRVDWFENGWQAQIYGKED